MTYMNRYRLIYTLLLTALMASMNASAGVTVKGNVYGGGNQADVKTNATVNIGGGQIDGNVYGGGKGSDYNYTCDKAMVGVNDDGAGIGKDPSLPANKDKGTKVTITAGTVGTLLDNGKLKKGTGNVYGGGEIGRVEWNSQVKIGVENASSGDQSPIILGSVFGAGKGNDTHGFAALVRGNCTVTIQGKAWVKENVYGGGEMATAGRYWVKNFTTPLEGEIMPDAPEDLDDGMPYATRGGGGVCTVIVQDYAQIGPATATDLAGHVFGAGKGVTPSTYSYEGSDMPERMSNSDVMVPMNNPTAYFQFLETLSLATKTHVTISETAQVKGNVYGGSESGFVQDDTDVKIQAGTIGASGSYGNVFGGGKGLAIFAEAGKVKGNTNVAISGGTMYGNVYGGGELGDVGTINKADIRSYTWKANTGKCEVIIDGATADIKGHVFGAGKGKDDTFWCEKAMVNNTSVSIAAGKVEKDVYGGGEIGRVEYDTQVKIGDDAGANKPEINGSVFGAGAGVNTHGYSALVRGNTTVTIQAKTEIGKSVYGGGQIASVGKYGLDAKEMPSILKGGGVCAVIVKGEAKVGVDGGGDVFGAGQGIGITSVTGDHKRMTLINGVSDWENYSSDDAYKTFLQTLGLATAPTVTIEGSAFVNGSVYGGGEVGITKGTVIVNINDGTIEKDVYGGGKLADTNTGNWSPNKYFIEVTELKADQSYFKKEDVYTEITDEEAVAEDGITYYTKVGETYEVATVTPGETPVNGKYTKSENYTAVTYAEATANPGTYYETKAEWTDEDQKTSLYKTTVNLLGGLIKGDAYGGGLGQKVGFNGASTGIPAIVWGDIEVTLNGSKFNITTYSEDGYTDIVKSGRVFGCNNLNGYPKGDVTVTVRKTVAGSHTRTAITRDEDEKFVSEASPRTYEVAAVYGGGNLADDETDLAGKKTKVIIETCNVSIREVYGGGNAAAVPETEVLVKGAYEIETVFGGGNGKDPYKKGTEWIANSGADVNGDTNTQLTGGFIHEAYGGSNKRGRIAGKVKINTGSGGTCMLECSKVVAAGKDADLDTDAILVMGCVDGEKIDQVIGGADNANVNGNVWLTITSGEFGKVFGGNNLGGVIKGSIKLNIEETGCTPIKIDELYLGGNEAAYSVYGYYKEGDKWKPRTSDADAHKPVDKDDREIEIADFTPYDDPVLNIISCTKIGKVFGGGLGTGAAMYANPTVNINMRPGVKASGIPTVMTAMGLIPSDNPNYLGIIGDVYGGGNKADVIGNPTVNIGTESKVMGLDLDETGDPQYESDGITPKMTDKNVVGAYINGNVYGGGKGSADTFTCEKAMVGKNGDGIDHPDGGTTVNIYKGLVKGNVYGGGEVGRVEKNTQVKIGNGIGSAEGPAEPVIMGSVFGGGKGEKTHGYSALVRGNPTVTIEGNAKVLKSVYGGGEIASVARYDVSGGSPVALAQINGHYSGYCTVTVQGYAEIGPDGMKMYHSEITDGTDKPDDFGHIFAAGKGVLPTVYDYAKPATNVQANYHTEQYDIDDHMPKRMVFYGDKKSAYWEYADPDFEEPEGATPSDLANQNVWEYFTTEKDYFDFIETLALATQTNLTIGGHAFVKGSAYGGSENGTVQFNTNVTIQDYCQIGQGQEITTRYEESLFDLTTPPLKSGSSSEYYNLECASWKYGKVEGSKTIYAPYDPNANATEDLDKYPKVDSQSTAMSTEGGRRVATDGHTYYGNVFGGGSGSVPYFDTQKGISRYIMTAGQVKGDATVTITGGHILTNVYGGCEATNVLGKATVKMTGGTLGVPRTPAQIQAHPVTCYLFGAGKGDQRVFFNKDTNVQDAEVEVDGGRIYGSVYGGGEDGHVMRHSMVTIKQSSGKTTKIGTTGTTYLDGNVFGGGRGFGGDALTAGNVGGCVEVNIEGGTMLGSVYGGGRLASVGYGLYLSTGDEAANYGKMRADNEYDDPTNPITTQDAKTFFESHPFTSGTFTSKGRGYITVNIKDGTIGNDVANAQYGGHVFGGSMGRLTKLDGSTNDLWNLLATAKKTTVNVTGGTIKRSVFGGGEMGTVTTDTKVTVSGGTIGTATKGGTEFGNVYGGGKGYFDRTNPNKLDYVLAGIVKGNTEVKIENGTSGSTTTTPTILHNIYGGGAYGSVGTIKLDNATYVPGQATVTNMPTTWTRKTGSTGTDTGTTTVTVTGGTIGSDGKDNGMVFGSSRGDVSAPTQVHDHMAWVYNTHVTIGTSGQDTTTPLIKGSVYGSGENGHVFQNTIVDIHSGTIGINSTDEVTYKDDPIDEDKITYNGKHCNYPYRGNVYGGGCGTDKYHSTDTETYLGDGDTYNALAGIVLGTATVNIDGGLVVHNVYGAGAMGSVGTTEPSTTEGISTRTFTSDTGKTTINISGGTVGVDGTSNGNVFGAARGDVISTQSNVALVKTTDVKISGSSTLIKGNVYGGGEAGDVGTYTTVAADGGGHYKGDNVYPEGSGICNVTVEGGTIHRNVFGAGKGVANTFQCAKAMASSANVTITGGKVGTLDAGGKLKENTGNVYGGGEVGRVEHDTQVKIGDDAGANKPEIYGSVFGAGAGVVTHGYSALVRGNTTVTIQAKSEIGKSVYGGGQIASVGKYGLDAKEMPSILKGGGVCAVTIKDNVKVGVKGGGDVFGAGQGIDKPFVSGESQRMTVINGVSDTEYFTSPESYKTFLETLGLATAPTVNIEGSAFVNGSVYGGGEVGITKGAVVVNIKGGTIEKDVYGGGKLADTNTGNRTHTYAVATPPYATSETLYTRTGAGTDESPYKYEAVENIVEGTTYYKAVEVWADNNKQTALHTTSVNLTGGVIKGDAYGGGLGDADHPALVYGDVQVELNGTTVVTNDVSTPTPVTGKGCQVSRVFGCNNVNGSPKGKVNVHVYATQREGKNTVGASDKVAASKYSGGENDGEWNPNTFDVQAVYGGGNMAAYEPVNALLDYSVDANKDAVNAAYARVIIDGCDLTSIGQVYGGGNAASAPATYITINGDYEIGEVFGGGNGKDRITKNDVEMDNPGANVGFHAYPEGTTYDVRNAAPYIYGSGVALTEIFGGIVHAVYGGSNSKGNIRTESHVILDDQGCHFDVGEAYGGGKSADMDGAANLEIRCISQMGIIYGGAENADVLGDVTLNVTNGHYDQVFGGNNEGGRIGGSITVNIEETGCNPIIIGELYGGGNKAGYSKWGYKKVSGKWLPRESKTDNDGEEQYTTGVGENGYDDPQVNVKSFTSIGNIFGGGYGESAKMVADPHIYIDEVSGLWYDDDKSVFTEWTGDIDGDIVTIPAHTKGTAIGAIQNVFGGGNAAPVIGTPHVYIGTQEYVKIITGIVVGTTDVRGYYTLNNGSYTEVKGDNAVPAVANTTYYKKVVGVDIRGNVYGGGNNATVTGDTDVQIGRKIE